jgi:hypothetical protein
MSEINRQEAPYPHVLADLVSKLKYRSGWSVNLVDMPRDRDQEGKVLARGLTLRITTVGYDTYHPDVPRRALHACARCYLQPAVVDDVAAPAVHQG